VTARPTVIAHRGASADWPEHTAAAYAAAIDAGTDTVECDVRLSADGVPVCVHDRRVDRTSDGTGRVADLELSRLRDLDWGSWHPAVRGGLPAPADPVRLLTLADLVDLLVGAPRPVGLFVETKHPVRRGSRVEAAVAEAVAPALGRLPVVAGMSFWPPAVARFRTIAHAGGPDLIRVRLRPGGLVLPAHGAPQAVGLAIRSVRRRPGIVAAARRSGLDVHVWTVDEPVDVRLCLDLGVDGIITNRPAEIRAMLPR
jgi:glycerophosphoryl diester phosphodiesterase